jgi:hypothetical protein
MIDKRNIPLDLNHQLMFLFLPWMIFIPFGFILFRKAARFNGEGYKKKFNTCWNLMMINVMMYSLIFILLIQLDIHYWHTKREPDFKLNDNNLEFHI